MKYDAEKETVRWEIPTLTHTRYGQIALPFGVEAITGDKKNLTKDQKDEIKAMTETSFLLVPLYGEKDQAGTYEAANGFGAKTTVTSLKGTRYSIALNMGRQMVMQPFLVANVPLPRDKAADLIPNLDVRLYWVTSRPCADCLTAGRLTETNPGGPTFSNPIDMQLEQKFVYGSVVAVRLIDRRDGKTYAIATMGKAYLAQ